METIIWAGIASVVMLAVFGMTMAAGRSFAALANYAELDNHSRNALDLLSFDVRQMEYLTNFSTTTSTSPYSASGVITNYLAFAPTPGAASNNWVTYNYDQPARTLTRSSNGTSQVLLDGCDYLNFTLYKRNVTNFNALTTTNLVEVKLIKVEWICSRSMIGTGLYLRTNTESVQSAKFVIRHH